MLLFLFHLVGRHEGARGLELPIEMKLDPSLTFKPIPTYGW